MTINQIIIFVLQTSAIAGFITWLVKLKIKNSGDRNLERLKSDLQIELKKYESQNNRILEEFKSKLNELNIKFSALHTERLKIVKELYGKLVSLNSALYILTMPIKPIMENFDEEENARMREADKSFKDFANYFAFNKIYFSESLSEKLEDFRSKSFSVNWDHSTTMRYENWGMNRRDANAAGREELKKASETVRQDLFELLKEIETEFRQILGVN